MELDRIYALEEISEEDGMKVADLEIEFAEMDGYTAESSAGDLLLGVGIPLDKHDGPMSSLAPGLKLRVLLAQVLFGNPDILLLDEPTNNTCTRLLHLSDHYRYMIFLLNNDLSMKNLPI